MLKRFTVLFLLLLFTTAIAACAGQPVQIDGGIEINPPEGGQPSGDTAFSDNTLLTVGVFVVVVLLAFIAGALLSNRGRS
jgi:hypothetical protein